MSYQLQGLRVGLINKFFDNIFFDCIVDDVEELLQMLYVDYVCLLGLEGVELVMWFIVWGVLNEMVEQ